MVKYLFIETIIIFLTIKSLTSVIIDKRLMIGESFIIATIQKSGYYQILSPEFNADFPDEIWINEQKLTKRLYNYNFKDNNNTIKYIWNKCLKTADYLFKGCSAITYVDLKNFNFSLVESTKFMFLNCLSLSSIDLPNLKNSSLLNLHGMFYNCSSLISLRFSYFNISLVKDMSFLFYGCSSLSFLDLSNFNTSLVTTMRSMFYGCSSLKSLNISNFNTSLVSYMNYMFYGCFSLEILDLSNFNTSSVIKMNSMFCECSSLNSLVISNFDTSRVEDMSFIFYGCYSLNFLDLSNFNTSSVKTMTCMFYECFSLNSLVIYKFDTCLVEDMSFMFYGCSSLNFLDLSNFNTSSTKTMKSLFYKCSFLNSLDLSKFDTSHIEEMSYMFYGCSSLNSLDLSNFNTSLVTTMRAMFYNCFSLDSINLTSFHTSSLIEICYMFYGCKSLKILNISNFNASYIKDMSYMFNLCYNLISLDLSNFYTESLQKISYMFYKCYSLQSLNMSNFNFTQINTLYGLFEYCTNLTVIDLRNAIMDESLLLEFINIHFLKAINCNKEKNNSNINSDCEKYSSKGQKTFIYNKSNLLKNKYDNSIKRYETEQNCYNDCPDKKFLLSEKIIFDIKTLNQKEYGKCIQACPNDDVIDKENINNKICKHEYLDIFFCTYNNHNSNLYKEIYCHEDNTYIKLDSEFNIECYNSPFGFYLDKDDFKFKKCYNSCRICDQIGNDTYNNCIECKSNYQSVSFVGSNYLNCFCPNYLYYDIDVEQYFCTENLFCPKKYNKLISIKNLCVDDCQKDSNYKYDFRNICYEKCPNGSELSINKEYFCEALCSQEYPFVIVETQECVKGCSINTLKEKTCFLKYTENKTLYNEISYNIISDLLSGSYNGEIEKMIQKNNSYNITITQGNDLHFISDFAQYMERIDISTINFRSCENLLKTQYKFNNIEDLIMYKIEHNVTGFKIPIIE